MSERTQRSRAEPPWPSGRPVLLHDANRIVEFMQRQIAAGINGDDLIFGIDAAFPNFSFRAYAGALALYRARSGAEGYALISMPETITETGAGNRH